jgi:hypothetical protein
MINNPSRPHVRRRALYAIRALAECDSSMFHWLSPEVSRCLRDKDDTVVGCAITICGSLYKVRQNRSALQHGSLMSPEWIVRARCTRTCISGLAPLWEVLHRVSRSDAGNPESPAAIFHRSVSPCGLSRARRTTCWGQTFCRSAEDRRRTYQTVRNQAKDS